MNAMTILKRCRAAKSDIGRLLQRIEQRRDVLDSLSAPQADPNGGSRGTGDKDKIGKILADIDELEREVEARKEKYTAGYVRKTKRNGEQLLEMLSPERVDSVLPAWYLREKGGA